MHSKAEDWPEKPETEPNPYTHEELRAMMGAASRRAAPNRFSSELNERSRKGTHRTLDERIRTFRVQPSRSMAGLPRTAAGTRKIPLGMDYWPDLRDHCASGLLFPHPTTGSSRELSRIFRGIAAREARPRSRRLHSSEDTFATGKSERGCWTLRDIAKSWAQKIGDEMKLYAALLT